MRNLMRHHMWRCPLCLSGVWVIVGGVAVIVLLIAGYLP